MIIFLVLIGVCLLLPPTGLLNFCAELSAFAQQLCTTPHQQLTSYTFMNHALACGIPPTSNESYEQLKRLSVVHLFVISGAHLLWIDQFLNKILQPITKERSRPYLVLTLLGVYSIFTGWNPPVVRAFFYRALRAFSKNFNLNWSPFLTSLLTGPLILILFPQWTNRFSLLLSWFASSIIIAIPKKPPLITNILMFFGLSVFWLSPTALHPLSIIYLVVLSPIVGFIFLPMSLATVLIPFLGQFTDFFWRLFFAVVNWLDVTFPYVNESTYLIPPQRWILSLSLLFLIHHLDIQFKRQFSGKPWPNGSSQQ